MVRLDELFRTRDGHPIVMRRKERAQEMKPGLITDEVQAFVNGEMVGYLTFDYTSPSIMDEECGNLFTYLDHWTGGHYGPDSKDGKSLEEFTLEEAAGALKGVQAYYLNYKRWYDEDEFNLALLDRGRAIALLSRFIAEGVFKHTLEKREAYIEFACHPYIAYVSTAGNTARGLVDHSGKGIGEALYVEAARWILERKLDRGIYASSLQSEEAQHMWEKFAAKGWVKKVKGRMFLDARSTLN